MKNVSRFALGSLAVLSASAHATIPAGVQTAIDSVGTNALAVAGTILVAIVGVYALKFIRKGL